MEFFRTINIQTNESEIQKLFNNTSISDINPNIVILEKIESILKIGCLWGEFTIRWDQIKGGVRYSMLDCPNALAWTITTGYPPKRDNIVIHLTINRIQKQQEFIDEINEFMDDWEEGIIDYLKSANL